MARAPRQADIAAAAGVSQTTVSLILSGNTDGVRLSESTRQRVLKAAEKLGYVPDPVATRLASSRNHMLGVYTFASAFPTDVDGFYYPILVGIEEEAAALGQDLVLFTGTGGLEARADDKLAIRRTRIADGCLFFGRHVPEEPIDWLLGGGFPLVYIGRMGRARRPDPVRGCRLCGCFGRCREAAGRARASRAALPAIR